MESITTVCLVSVIIPTYNNDKTIVPALQSVYNQSFRQFEIILVNDGSTDNTAIEITNYLNTLSTEDRNKLHYICKQNSGPSESRNLAIDKSQGQYIAFLDADDCWSANKLEVQLSYFDKYPHVPLIATAFGSRRFSSDIQFKFVTFHRLLWNNLFSTPAVMVKRERLSDLKFNVKQRFSEDYRLWLAISSTDDCIYINQVLAKNQFNKVTFGESGLSSNLVGMIRGELSNFHYLLKTKKISLLKFLLVSSYSILKFVRRLLITSYTTLKNRRN